MPREFGGPPLGPKLLVGEDVALPHRLEQLGGALLVLLHLCVPRGVELLELEHVRLLDAEPLRNLPRAKPLLPPVLLVRLELLQSPLRD